MCINMSKVCTNCKQTKTHCEFTKQKTGKNGLNSKCKECKKIENKHYRNNNPQYFIEYKEKHKDTLQKYNKKYVENNKTKLKENRRQYENKKLQNPTEKLKHYLRVYIGQTIKEIGVTKHKKTLNIVGLDSWNMLREHIESQWTEGMDWSNHGIGKNNTTWHIDHIIPISFATTEEDVYRLNHYTNLRPMWGSDNIRKKDKVLPL